MVQVVCVVNVYTQLSPMTVGLHKTGMFCRNSQYDITSEKSVGNSREAYACLYTDSASDNVCVGGERGGGWGRGGDPPNTQFT